MFRNNAKISFKKSSEWNDDDTHNYLSIVLVVKFNVLNFSEMDLVI